MIWHPSASARHRAHALNANAFFNELLRAPKGDRRAQPEDVHDDGVAYTSEYR